MAETLRFTPTALHALDEALRAAPSATRTLENWCADHAIPGRMHIERLPGTATPPPDLAALFPSAAPLRYRHIRMFCGPVIVSEAQNWYRPDALTAAMNATLDETDTPFGLAVADLAFRRTTLLTQLNPIAATLEHRAALYSDDDPIPFSIVIERYGTLDDRNAD